MSRRDREIIRRPEPIRLLHRKSQLGYTEKPHKALPREPEAVSRDEQRLITEHARNLASNQERREWEERRQVIEAQLGDLYAYRVGPRIAREIDYVRRLVRQVDQTGTTPAPRELRWLERRVDLIARLLAEGGAGL